MVTCPICQEEGFERGIQFSGKWVCSDCIHEIAIAHNKIVRGGKKVWKEIQVEALK